MVIIQNYDNNKANGLIPFLASISNEVRERRIAIKRVDLQLESEQPESDTSINLQAERANHRRELRLALKEVSRLGCTVSREFPLRVVIPGPNGELDGFLWESGEASVRSLATESAA